MTLAWLFHPSLLQFLRDLASQGLCKPWVVGGNLDSCLTFWQLVAGPAQQQWEPAVVVVVEPPASSHWIRAWLMDLHSHVLGEQQPAPQGWEPSQRELAWKSPQQDLDSSLHFCGQVFSCPHGNSTLYYWNFPVHCCKLTRNIFVFLWELNEKCIVTEGSACVPFWSLWHILVSKTRAVHLHAGIVWEILRSED